jgi:hypothetical protein
MAAKHLLLLSRRRRRRNFIMVMMILTMRMLKIRADHPRRKRRWQLKWTHMCLTIRIMVVLVPCRHTSLHVLSEFQVLMWQRL